MVKADKPFDYKGDTYGTKYQNCMFGIYGPDENPATCDTYFKPFFPKRTYDGSSLISFLYQGRNAPIYLVEEDVSCGDIRAVLESAIDTLLFEKVALGTFCLEDPTLDPATNCSSAFETVPRRDILQLTDSKDPIFSEDYAGEKRSPAIVCQTEGTKRKYTIRYDVDLGYSPTNTKDSPIVWDGYISGFHGSGAPNSVSHFRYNAQTGPSNYEIFSLLSAASGNTPVVNHTLSVFESSVIQNLLDFSRVFFWSEPTNYEDLLVNACSICHSSSKDTFSSPADAVLCNELNEIFRGNDAWTALLTETRPIGPLEAQRCYDPQHVIAAGKPDDFLSLELNFATWFTTMIQPIVAPFTPLRFFESSVPTFDFRSFRAPENLIEYNLWANLWGIIFIVSINNGVKYMMLEKVRGLRDVLEIMGVGSNVVWFTWYLSLALWYLPLTLVITAVSTIFYYLSGNFIILWLNNFLYTFTFFPYFIFISSLFSNVSTGTVVGIILFMMMFYPSFSFNNWLSTVASTKAIFLLPPSAFVYGHNIMLIRETGGMNPGISWDSLTTPFNGVSLLQVWGFYILDAVIFFLIGWYIHSVFPGEYGISQPWYFLFSPRYWKSWGCGCGKDSVPECPSFEAIPPPEGEYFEPLPEDYRSKPAFVQCVDLRKEFYLRSCCRVSSVVEATKGSTFTAHQGEILALLGHNGAGKTTTISMLTGILPATSGTATIMGYNMKTDFHKARKYIGYCPQHDILFHFMTVRQHLEFYCRLRGYKASEMKDQIEHVSETLALHAILDTKALKISGGEKRRLSIASVFVGKPSVVFLDEPSTGLDTYNRRKMWDMLRNVKQDCCIILTTHAMEEADFLADRIAIFAKGDIVVMGSPFFLKDRFNLGYSLVVTTKDVLKNNDLESFLTEQIGGNCSFSYRGTDCLVTFPFDVTPKLSEILKNIESEKEEQNITSLSIAVTSVETVFSKVYDMAYPEKLGSTKNSGEVFQEISEHKNQEVSSTRQFFRHFSACVKNLFFSYGRSQEVFILNLIPVLLLFACLEVWRIILLPSDPIDITFGNLEAYEARHLTPQTIPFAVEKNTDFDDRVEAILQSCVYPGVEMKLVEASDIESFESYLARSTFTQPTDRWINAAVFIPSRSNASETDPLLPLDALIFFNATYRYAIPSAYFLLTSCLLAEDTGSPEYLDVLMHPMAGGFSGFPNTLSAMYVSMCLGILTAMYSRSVILDRIQGTKHLKDILGLNTWSYYCAHLSMTTVFYFLTAAFMWLIIEIYDSILVVNGESRGATAITFVLYVLAVTPFEFCFSWFFARPEDAHGANTFLALTFTIFPSVIQGSAPQYYDYLKYLFSLHPSGAMTDALLTVATKMSFEGMLSPFLFLSMEAVLFFVFAVLLDIKISQKRNKPVESCTCCPAKLAEVPEIEMMDQNAQQMDEEIAYSLQNPQKMAETPLLVHDTHRSFVTRKKCQRERKHALDGFSLCVKPGISLCLLGVNGSGKTTLLKCITGVCEVDDGSILIHGKSALTERKEAWKFIGLCPQEGGLDENLTGAEMLGEFGRICNIPESKLSSIINETCSIVDVYEYRHQLIRTYSGGNKRKLNLAVALLASPKLLLLDEPSSGVDCKNKILSIITSWESEKKAMIFTTHSLEECERVADEIAIMGYGKLLCIGSTAYLKSTYGKSFEVEVTFQNLPLETATTDERMEAFLNCLKTDFPDAVTTESFGAKQRIRIPKTEELKVSGLFDFLECHKTEFGLHYFTVSSSSLDSIFYDLNHAEREAAVDVYE